MKLKEFNRNGIKMVLVQCDHNENRTFEISATELSSLEKKFDGKHYHNESIFELEKAGVIKVSKFSKKY